MDIGNDEQQIADANTTNATHSIIEATPNDGLKAKDDLEIPMKVDVTEAPEPAAVLERPREGDDAAQQPSTQMRKTPPRLYPTFSLEEHGLTQERCGSIHS